MEKRQLLLGDEAIAQGALDAGISGTYAYPGTPSTETMEFVQASEQAAAGRVHREWSSNEKTAYEAALGMAYAGRRVLVCMKHVGLNVAADAFVNSAITGVNGGLVVLVADDPSMHSSQNEQDTRRLADFALVPVLEPASQQEAYDMTIEAFERSEALRLPVLIRVTTRLAHSRAGVSRREPRPQNPMSLPQDHSQFTLLPAHARKNYLTLIQKWDQLREQADESPWNPLMMGADTSRGIVVAGLAGNYLREVLDPCPHPVLHVRHYPLPVRAVRRLYEQCDELLIIEDGSPFIEEQVAGLLGAAKPVRGRRDGSLPRTGELSPELVAAALGMPASSTYSVPETVRPRPPQLCRGCPHIDTYNLLNAALEQHPGARVFADIGCYTLGALPPFQAIHTCVDMGAAITMAKGGADAGIHPAIAVIGDSTFTHSGMTGLLDAVHENTNMTVMILDNDTTGMTGQQLSMATGRLPPLCRGLGVPAEHVREIVPLKKNHQENLAVLEAELAHPGVSVILSTRPCIQIKRRV